MSFEKRAARFTLRFALTTATSESTRKSLSVIDHRESCESCNVSWGLKLLESPPESSKPLAEILGWALVGNQYSRPRFALLRAITNGALGDLEHFETRSTREVEQVGSFKEGAGSRRIVDLFIRTRGVPKTWILMIDHHDAAKIAYRCKDRTA
jgi:hypothetical protein